MPRTHSPYPSEFKAEAVRLAKGSDKAIPALAADLGVSSAALRHWLRQADADAQRWSTRAAARTAIFEWIEVFYNRQRLHSALTYQAPTSFEDGLLLLRQPAA